VSLKTASPLVVDPFDQLPSNAGAILVDETSNSTIAAVLIQTINA
jgi:sulfate adenylyltransferase subunit 1